MKKLLSKLLACAMIAGLLTTGMSAAIGDIKYEIKNTTKAPVMDGKVTQAEYAGNAPIVLDGSGKNTEGTWTANKWAKQVLKFYYTWDAKNIYVGVTVENDTSESQSGLPKIGDGNVCPFGKGDSIQLGFNPGSIVKGTHPVLYCVGFNDGKTFVHGDAFHSLEDGKQALEASSFINGFCSKYSKDGINYQCEVTIPWDKICMNGAGRSGEGAKKFDMTGELKKIGDGYMLPVFMVYTDCGNGTTHMRTDSTTGNKWVAEEMGSIALVLKDVTPKAPASAPATADAASLAVFAALASAAAAAVVLKKRK